MENTILSDVFLSYRVTLDSILRLAVPLLDDSIRRVSTRSYCEKNHLTTTSEDLGAPILGPATTQNLVVKFDGEIRDGVLAENASDNLRQQKKLENLLPNFAGSSPPIPPKTSPTSLSKLLVLTIPPPPKQKNKKAKII